MKIWTTTCTLLLYVIPGRVEVHQARIHSINKPCHESSCSLLYARYVFLPVDQIQSSILCVVQKRINLTVLYSFSFVDVGGSVWISGSAVVEELTIN